MAFLLEPIGISFKLVLAFSLMLLFIPRPHSHRASLLFIPYPTREFPLCFLPALINLGVEDVLPMACSLTGFCDGLYPLGSGVRRAVEAVAGDF